MYKFLEKFGIHLKLTSRFFKIAAAALIVLIGLIVWFAQYSEDPSFCNSCHIMKPYYQAWKTSSHNFVKCVDCHYPPSGPKQFIWRKFQSMNQVVKYVTRTYGTKPYAEVDDSSCLREGCHSKRLLEGKVTFEANVVFDHRPHLIDLRRGKKLQCTSCHSQIVQGKHIEVTKSTCFICHFKKDAGGNRPKISNCNICHKISAISPNHKKYTLNGYYSCEKCHFNLIEGEGNASKDICFNCHNDIERIKKFNDSTFIHQNHVAKHKVECNRCHSEIKHEISKSVEPLESLCSSCHASKHFGTKDMYMGIGGKGVKNSPNVMFSAQVTCNGCHKTNPIGNSCKSCHDESYSSILESWKDDLALSIIKVGQKLNVASSLIINNRHGNAYRLYKDAEYNYFFVKGSNGIHNYDYAAALLKKAGENLDIVISVLQSGIPR